MFVTPAALLGRFAAGASALPAHHEQLGCEARTVLLAHGPDSLRAQSVALSHDRGAIRFEALTVSPAPHGQIRCGPQPVPLGSH